MKKRFSILFLCLSALLANAQEDYNSLWKKASGSFADKKYPEAIAFYSKIIDELKISNDSIHYQRSKVFYEIGDLHRALIDVNKAVQLNEHNHEYYFFQGLLKSKSENYPGAIKAFNKAISLKPDNAKYYYDRAIAFLMAEDIEDAVKDLDKAIELRADYAHAFFSRGYCKHLLGKDEEAMKDLNKAIELDSSYKEPYIQIALIYLKSGDEARACEELQKAAKAGITITDDIKKNFCK